MKTIDLEEFKKIGRERFGDDTEKWKFVCPRCGESQSAEDLVKTGVDKSDVEKYVGFSCIGRFTKERGCDWTLGGLFQLHNLEIVTDDGKHHPHFELAESAQPHKE